MLLPTHARHILCVLLVLSCAQLTLATQYLHTITQAVSESEEQYTLQSFSVQSGRRTFIQGMHAIKYTTDESYKIQDMRTQAIIPSKQTIFEIIAQRYKRMVASTEKKGLQLPVRGVYTLNDRFVRRLERIVFSTVNYHILIERSVPFPRTIPPIKVASQEESEASFALIAHAAALRTQQKK